MIITNHYTQINVKLRTLLDQLNIVYTCRVGKSEGRYLIGKVEINIYPCRDAEGIERFRGHKCDALFTEEDWLAEEEVRWRLAIICRYTIYPINTLMHLIKGEGNFMYDYKSEMIKNIKSYVISHDWVEKNYHSGDDYYEMLDKLYDELWDKDQITGNGQNYYDSEKNCAIYVMENLPLYFEAARELNAFPMTQMSWEKEHAAQHMDAIIRCYLLRDCLEEACEEL